MFQYDGETSFDMPINRNRTHEHPRLNGAFNFNNGELRANREGRIPISQTKKLSHHFSSQSPYGMWGWILAGSFFIPLLILKATGNNELTGTASSAFLLYLVLISIPAVFLAFNIQNTVNDEKQEGVQHITGKLQKNTNELEINIGEETFYVTQHQYAVLLEGETYTIYFTKPSYFILSIEYADAAKNKI